MEPDDELELDAASSRLLPAPDRLWRHPSEVGYETGAGTIAGPGGESRLLTVAVMAATMGALLATGLIVVLVGIGHQVRTVAVLALERHAEPVTVVGLAGAQTAPVDVVAITQQVGTTVVGLVAPETGVALGSAVMFRSDGCLLTDSQVVAGATTLTVVLADARRVPARVLGVDPDSGVALLKIGGSGYEVAALGSTANLHVGEPAIAVGAAIGVAQTTSRQPNVAVGTVRAVGRSIDDGKGHQLAGMIETNTPIVAGSWGGALVDGNGVVIGINVAPRRATAGGATVEANGGYATPIDLAYAAASELMTGGPVSRPWLGIEGRDLDSTTAKVLGVPGGAVVDHVSAASPAATAGLKAGDVITAIDGRLVDSMAAFMVALRMHRPGQWVLLRVRQGGQERILAAVLSRRPASSA